MDEPTCSSTPCPRCVTLEREIARLKDELDVQRMPNRREPLRGGYEFYINEEWVCLNDADLGDDPGFHAALMKVRYDPDDERVRVRRIIDDDAILNELHECRKALAERENSYGCKNDIPKSQ